MSHVAFIVKKTFNKVFRKAAEEKGVKPENINLGIYFVNGEPKFKIYIDKQLVEKEVDISAKYLTLVDFGWGAFLQTVAAAGPKFARELSEKFDKKVVSDDLTIILYYANEEIPKAELRAFGAKQRDINIEEEFLK